MTTEYALKLKAEEDDRLKAGPEEDQPVPGSPWPSPDAVVLEQYRNLLRRHIQALPALFTKFTGLYSHLAWAPSWPCAWSAQELPTHSRLCRRAVGGEPDLLKRCQRCASRHLALTFKAEHKGHHFTCFLKVQNYWLPLILRGSVIGLAFVQAMAAPGAVISQSARVATRSARGLSSAAKSRQPTESSRRTTNTEFREAARLLQLVFRHVETSALAELRKSDLVQAQRALQEMQTVTTRLRVELNGLVPAFSKSSILLQSVGHPQRTVRAVLDFIHQHCSRPVTLRQCADRLHLNPAYLSALFSSVVGVPFKTYITELRIEKARELLGDQGKTIADVACAVGYASENRFRIAFKKMTGLSPRLWRETLQVRAPNAPH